MQSPQARLSLLKEHLELFETTWGSTKNFAIMKKFFKVYLQGFSGAALIRAALVQCNTIQEVVREVDRIQESI
jgi:tRNA-dihydrouridine synthase